LFEVILNILTKIATGKVCQSQHFEQFSIRVSDRIYDVHIEEFHLLNFGIEDAVHSCLSSSHVPYFPLHDVAKSIPPSALRSLPLLHPCHLPKMHRYIFFYIRFSTLSRDMELRDSNTAKVNPAQ
jgi:hypothetical protein